MNSHNHWKQALSNLPPSCAKNGRKNGKIWGNSYGAFSSAFVDEALQRLGTPYEGLVVDPMAGTGSVMLGCLRHGIRCLAFDLNPTSAILNRIRTPRYLRHLRAAERFCAEAQCLLRELEAEPVVRSPELTADTWLTTSQQSLLARFGERLRCAPALQHIRTPDGHASAVLSEHDFPLLALAVTSAAGYEFAYYSESSNRTWLKPGGAVVPISIADCFSRACTVMLRDLRELHSIVGDNCDGVDSFWCDAASLPIADGIADFVLTSPPYPNRMDYLRMSGPALSVLEAMCGDATVGITESMLGANVVRHLSRDHSCSDSPYIVKLVDAVEHDKAHGSKNYYGRYYRSYFSRLSAIVGEIRRVLSSSGAALVVVQDCFRLSHRIDMGKAVVELAGSAGLDADVARGHEVRFFGRIQRDTIRNSNRLHQTEQQVLLVQGERA